MLKIELEYKVEEILTFKFLNVKIIPYFTIANNIISNIFIEDKEGTDITNASNYSINNRYNIIYSSLSLQLQKIK